MPFLAYIAVILVSLGGILFELNWLTSPKLETKPAVQASATAPKVAAATTAPRNVAPSVTMVPAAPNAQQPSQAQADEPALKGSVASAPTLPEPPLSTPPQQQVAASAPAMSPTPFGSTETTGIASPDFKREFTTDVKSGSALSSATFTSAVTAATPAVASSSNNKCDIAACSAAYQSFRASDCSYQPMDGNARKVCDRPQGGAQQANIQSASAPAREHKVEAVARKPNRETGLRSFEREVRRITDGEMTTAPGVERRMGRSEVIVYERPNRDW